MTLDPDEIDWSATWAGFSALLAVCVFAWSMRWSIHQMHRERLALRAENRRQWVVSVRDDLARFLAELTVAKGRPASTKTLDDETVIKRMALYHKLMLSIPVGTPHQDDLRTHLHELIVSGFDLEFTKFMELVNKTQLCALAVFGTEHILADNEAKGFDNYDRGART